MAAIRKAIGYAENALGIERLLLSDELRTSGQDVFLTTPQTDYAFQVWADGDAADARGLLKRSTGMLTPSHSDSTHSVPHGRATRRRL